MALRRLVAGRIRTRNRGTWPIDEKCGAVPANWAGWPSNKKFGLILTHDVENAVGLSRCRELAQIEMELGFRSSFNFVPEGSYEVPSDLRAWLENNNFEVGVHDLYHAGGLYGSRKQFQTQAKRINLYLRKWKSVGYRSGFMMRNLDWHHDLDVLYDASTFDTDPFEPQPDGAGTIFPYLEQSKGRRERDRSELESRLSSHGSLHHELQGWNDRLKALPDGYVELPYTLPQDSTLFLLLGEEANSIWTEKLNWIAEKGGMALLNTHPDYMSFGGERDRQSYPVEHYRAFLQYIVTNFRGQYWHALPRDAAKWFIKSSRQRASDVRQDPKVNEKSTRTFLYGRRAAVLLYSYYPADPRPRRAAEALVDAGMSVELLCLKETEGEARHEIINGVHVTRLPLGKTRAGKFAYIWQYSCFIIYCFTTLSARCIRGRFDLVHVHNMPDILVFAALFAKIRRSKIILDLHDPMPELMSAIYGFIPKHPLVKFLALMEKCSITFADHVLTVNEACRKIFTRRSCPLAKISVVMNAPDENVFHFVPATKKDYATQPFVIMYHGSIVERHGLDIAVKALQLISEEFPQSELHIFGKNNSFLEKVMSDSQRLGLNGKVLHRGATDHAGIVKAIDQCSVGIIPNRRSLFTEINTPTRIFEYLARGKPVIAPNSSGITDYFRSDEIHYFELGDAEDLARQLREVIRQPDEVLKKVRKGQEIFLAHRWSSERDVFLKAVERTIGRRDTLPANLI